MTTKKQQTNPGEVTIAGLAQAIELEGSKACNVLISVNTPGAEEKTPTHVVAVVDVSGSMGQEASAQDDKGKKEAHGLSLLDVTKHAVRTIINTLGPNDMFSLVSFHTNAKVEAEGLVMDKKGKKAAEKALDALTPLNTTNIWDGLHTALEIVRKKNDPKRLQTVLLLTDGQPNVVPPRGHIPMLKRYKDKTALKCTINTFGFGYNLDSQLLNDIAKEGNGTYSFIPDSGMVGTIFIHALSNLLSTFASNLKISLEPQNGAKIKQVYGSHLSQETSWGYQIDVGSLMYGQSKDLVVEMDVPEGFDKSYLVAHIEYLPLGENDIKKQFEEIVGVGDVPEVEVQRLRLEFARIVETLVSGMKIGDKLSVFKDLMKMIQASPVLEDVRVADLLKDVEGQVSEGIRPNAYQKWGRHFLPSLLRAHLLQQCNNFKDPGVQHYGGKLFESVRDHADEVFLKLPAPKPSIKKFDRRGKQVHRVPVNMNMYHNAYGGCIEGFCAVSMADGSTKLIKDLQKGDVVQTPSGPSIVRCVVKTMTNEEAELCQLKNDLFITPWHPVRNNGVWVFPSTLSPITARKCEAVYSFVLEDHHSMIVNGVECVSLGHDFKENDCIKHPLFGSPLIIKELQKMHGWNRGLVVFERDCFLRSSISGLLEKLDETKEIYA